MLDVRRGDDELGTLAAGKNAYSVEQQVSNEVGIRSDLLTGEDLFVIAEQVNEDGTVFFRVFVKPLVNLIWLAGLVFVLGSLIAFWPDAREERRLATRYPRGRDPGQPGHDVSVWLLLGAALVVAVVVVVALPFLREPAPESDALELGAAERERLAAEEARDRALSALRSSRPTTGPGGSRTTTIAASSACCGGTRPRRSGRSTGSPEAGAGTSAGSAKSA